MRSGKGDRLLDLWEKYGNLYLDTYELQPAFLPLFHENEEDTHRGDDNKGNHPQYNGGNGHNRYNGESGAHGDNHDDDNHDDDSHDDDVMPKR